MVWLDADVMSKIIDAATEIDPKVGGAFSIWDGYLTGTTMEIDPSKRRIVQTWRDNSTDWPENFYSKITLEFVADRANPKHTRLKYWHSGVPEKHAESIAEGWKDFYWEPIQKYFTS